MRVGNIDGLLGAEIFQTIYDSGELSSAQTSITISNLDGDNDKEYRLIVRGINGYSGGVNYLIRPNNDSGNNYGAQYLMGVNTTPDAYRFTGLNAVYRLGTANALNDVNFSETLIYAKSGYVRTGIINVAEYISGTSIYDISTWGFSWNNTSDNITSLVILASASDGFGVGSRIILMKKSNSTSKMKTGNLNVQGKVKGTFQKIYKTTLTGSATSVTISGLDGDIDQLYRLKVRFVNDYNGSSNYYLRPNNDSDNDYGYQEIDGTSGSASALRDTSEAQMHMGNAAAQNNLSFSESVLYMKSGYLRTAISKIAKTITGTTVTSINLKGQSYQDTSTNITSLVILADQTNGLGVGTVIELERYTP